MSRHRPTPIRRDLRDLAALHHLGAWANAVDELGKRFGGADVIPASTWRAVMAVHVMLADLKLTDASRVQVADVWRAP